MQPLKKLLNSYYKKEIVESLFNTDNLFDNKKDHDYRYHDYSMMSVFLKSITDEAFDSIKHNLNSSIERKLLEIPSFVYNYMYTALTKNNRLLYFREIGFDINDKDSHFLAIYGKLSTGNHIEILERLKQLPVFKNVMNEILVYSINSTINSYEVRVSVKSTGLPMYLASKDIVHFRWCLENGADIHKKTNQKTVYDDWMQSKTVSKYGDTMLNYYLKYDGLNCKDYLGAVKNLGYLDVFNEVTKSNLSSGKKIISYASLLEALISDDRDVYDNLEDYKDLILDSKYRSKNLLFHAISSNRHDWAEKIMDFNLVDRDDELNGNSVLIYAVKHSKMKSVRTIIEKQFYSKKELADGTPLYYYLMEKSKKLACSFMMAGNLPIDVTLNHPYANLKAWIYKQIISEDHQLMIKKMISSREKNIMVADIDEIGLKPQFRRIKI